MGYKLNIPIDNIDQMDWLLVGSSPREMQSNKLLNLSFSHETKQLMKIKEEASPRSMSMI